MTVSAPLCFLAIDCASLAAGPNAADTFFDLGMTYSVGRDVPVDLVTDIPEGIMMESYPGHYGQVLTNLFLNAVTHAFDANRGGTIRIAADRVGGAQVEVVFADDGKGMIAEVEHRAFDPFFTTRRAEGGSGLGLHIVVHQADGLLQHLPRLDPAASP